MAEPARHAFAERGSMLRRALAFLVGLLVLTVGGVFAANYVALGQSLARVLQADVRNVGLSASAQFGGYVDPSVLVFDLESVSSQNTPMDVFRTFLQFAAVMKDKRFRRAELAHRGEQNPIYTLRTFPEHLYHPDGRPAYGIWTGGVLGVLGKQMADFNDVHRKWYLEDLVVK